MKGIGFVGEMADFGDGKICDLNTFSVPSEEVFLNDGDMAKGHKSLLKKALSG